MQTAEAVHESAAVEDRPAGDYHLHDGRFGVWFSGPVHQRNDEQARRAHESLRYLLGCFGFTCEDVAPGRGLKGDCHGRMGDLEYHLRVSGRHVELTFFQNVVTVNQYGGRYDFDRLRKMPYLVRKRYEWTEMRLCKWFHLQGLPRRESRVSPWPDPLAWFNSRWDGEHERKRGTHRFERGPDGWPTERELASWKQLDADGRRITQGAERYVMIRGRAMRCRVYGGINGMWLCLYGGHRILQESAGLLRSRMPGRGRHFPPEERLQRMRRDLLRAVRTTNFRRAEAVSQAMRRQFPEHPIKLQVVL